MLIRIFILLSLVSSYLVALQSVKIGILAKRSPEITLKRYSATANYLTREIDGYHFEVVPLGFEELGESVANKKIDFLLTNTAFYVDLEHLYGVSRIATLKNINSDNIAVNSFGGVILSAADSDIKTLEDIKGKKFVAVNPNSFGGWIMAQKELLKHGVEIDDFEEFKFLGSHDSVVLAVINGEADAGTVRTDTLERMILEKAIDPNSFKILSDKSYEGFPFVVSTDLYPEWPFAKLSSTPQELADAVAVSLLKMPASSKAAKDAYIEGWTIPLDYSKVHNLLEELNLSFYGSLKEYTVLELLDKYKVWFLATLVIFMSIISILIYIYRLNRTLKNSKVKIEELNVKLETKVQERTAQLEEMYAHEKYLKDLLSSITDINEFLIDPSSKEAIISGSMKILAKHKEYRYIWLGLINQNTLEIEEQSSEQVAILDKKIYSLVKEEQNSSFLIAKNSIETNRVVIDKIENRSDESADLWSIAIPIRGSEHDVPIGVFCIYTEVQYGFMNEEVRILDNLATNISFALNTIEQQTMLRVMEQEKISNYDETILAFVDIIEQRDSYTAGHSLRVAKYSRMLAQEMGIDKDDIKKLEKASILHDIGKVVTPDAILLKPDKLTPLEYELIKDHPVAGYRMLSNIEMYKDLAQIIKYHHIRYDGHGYPEITDDLSPEVLMLSYIMAVADAFDAMTSNRIYKVKKTIPETIKEIQAYSGTQFHPEVVNAASKVLQNLKLDDFTQASVQEFEERRFAYFFRDSLTDVYNETYLKLVLAHRDDDQRCFYLIKLKNFSKYNNSFGWDSGNKFLKTFCSNLQRDYPDAMVFRYHGDDFVLLFSEHHTVEKESIYSYDIFERTGLDVQVVHLDLKDGYPLPRH